MNILRPFKILLLILSLSYTARSSCTLPANINNLVTKSGLESLRKYSDIARNYSALKGLCTYLISFKEGSLNWKMLLVTHPTKSHGLFWYLPHDNENSAFSAAVHATRKYGGGFLAVVTGGQRYFLGQDPNRNFSNSKRRICRNQKAPSPIYTRVVFSIIDTFRGRGIPYLALHNNTNRGGISVLKNSGSTKSFLAYPKKMVYNGVGLADEDSLVYIAGTSMQAPKQKVASLLNAGLNVKYEIVNRANYDCSMSNYVVLQRGVDGYYNIEAEHGKTNTQIEMINRLVNHIIRRK